jgi:hypothetical protein
MFETLLFLSKVFTVTALVLTGVVVVSAVIAAFVLKFSK